MRFFWLALLPLAAWAETPQDHAKAILFEAYERSSVAAACTADPTATLLVKAKSKGIEIEFLVECETRAKHYLLAKK